jgi:hypothetical protein
MSFSYETMTARGSVSDGKLSCAFEITIGIVSRNDTLSLDEMTDDIFDFIARDQLKNAKAERPEAFPSAVLLATGEYFVGRAPNGGLPN